MYTVTDLAFPTSFSTNLWDETDEEVMLWSQHLTTAVGHSARSVQGFLISFCFAKGCCIESTQLFVGKH